VVRGVAALVTSATGDEGASQRLSAYQPSEHQARLARAHCPRASDAACTMDHRWLSLRKRPAFHLSLRPFSRILAKSPAVRSNDSSHHKQSLITLRILFDDGPESARRCR